jgi:hypothetical protein
VATAEGKEYVHLILVLDTDDHTEVVAEVERYGGKVFSAYKDQVSVGVPVEMVRQQLTTEDPGAIFEDMTGFEHVIAVRLPEPMIPDGSEIEGEGVDVIDADAWHAAGITGAGVKVGILDMGFDNYQELLGRELPDDVTFQHFGPDPDPNRSDSTKVHGTACAEIVHEIAPDAELFLAQFGSGTAWTEAHDWLMDQDVDIISHSIGWSAGPRDGASWQAERVDELVSTHGILWVNAAGNDARSHYVAEYNDADGDGLHDFEPGVNLMAIANSGAVTIVLQWNDDWGAADQDYNLYAWDENGDEFGRGDDEQSGQAGHRPVEVIRGPTEGIIYVGVEARRINEPVSFDIYAPKARVEFPDPERSLGIPADARSAFTVGAVNWSDDILAPYSSQGPTDDGRPKPEISAPTNVQGASYAALDRNFTGTSAACPHVAGAAALVWQVDPGLTPFEVGGFLMANAVDLGPAGPDYGYGYGRLQLPGGEQEPPTTAPTVPPTELPTAVPTIPPPEPTVTPNPPTATPEPERPTAEPVEPTAEPVEPTAEPVEPTAEPVERPTQTPEPTSVPTNPPAATVPNTPEPTPTYASYTQLTPAPIEPVVGTGTMMVGAMVVVAGLGCGGLVLLIIGGVGLIVLTRRASRPQWAPPPARPGPAPYAPPPPPPPQAAGGYRPGVAGRPGPAVGQRYPQAPSPSPGGQAVGDQVPPTHILSGDEWGQLVVVGGPKQGVIFPLHQPVVTIGRAGGNDIVLQDSSVSGRHARIERRGTQVFVVDLNSSNGTRVNGQRVQQVQLVGGETIQLGETRLRIEMLA